MRGVGMAEPNVNDMQSGHAWYDSPVTLYALEEECGRWVAAVETFVTFGTGNSEEEAVRSALDALSSRLSDIAPMILSHESPTWKPDDFEHLRSIKVRAQGVWRCRVTLEATKPDHASLRIIVHEGELRRMNEEG